MKSLLKVSKLQKNAGSRTKTVAGGATGAATGSVAGRMYNKVTGETDPHKQQENMGKATTAGGVLGAAVAGTGNTKRVAKGVGKGVIGAGKGTVKLNRALGSAGDYLKGKNTMDVLKDGAGKVSSGLSSGLDKIKNIRK